MFLVEGFMLYEADSQNCAFFKTEKLAEQNRNVFEFTDAAIDKESVYLSEEDLNRFEKGQPVFS
jgi:hypothetical protein